MNAALRWAIARRDAGAGLRFVRALGYYWAQLGKSRRGRRAGPRRARAPAARPADQDDRRGAGDLRDAGGGLVVRP